LCLQQVLDRSDTFLETSVTAMTLYAMCTAVTAGWLAHADYDDSIQRAWTGMLSQISPSGNVSNICSGCGVQPSVAAYESHTRDYDSSQPGLGSVFQAILAFQKYSERFGNLANFGAQAGIARTTSVPVPNARQLAFMDLEAIQFMHFGVDTFWQPPAAYLRSANPTYHNCDPTITGLSHDNQTDGFWPCLHPLLFTPTQLNADNWIAASASLGMKEICLTAKHQGVRHGDIRSLALL